MSHASHANKYAQSRLKPAHAVVVKAWKVLVPICYAL
jgi:hypothetical protein